MQGQERDHVIVDYGISDEATIQNEIDFIYSRNRLNVSITRFIIFHETINYLLLLIPRAKKKCILFLAEALLNPIHEIFEKKASENGFSFLQVSFIIPKLKKLTNEIEINQFYQAARELF